MSPRRRIVIATTNAGKRREIRQVLGDLPVDWLTLDAFAAMPDVEEDGATFEANAAKKAVAYSHATGVWTLADDSGLEVDALNGRPGVHSARFAGPEQDDAANNARLIEELRSVPPQRRTARFRCALAVADGASVLAVAGGAMEGLIIDQPRGGNGFGYDPHFFVPDLDRTTAELSPEHKNRISHRGTALRALRPKLEALLQDNR